MSRDDLPTGVEHISSIIPRVLGDIARRAVKTALVEGYCRGILGKETVQRIFDRHDKVKGA